MKLQHNSLPIIGMDELSEILVKFINFAKRDKEKGVHILDDLYDD